MVLIVYAVSDFTILPNTAMKVTGIRITTTTNSNVNCAVSELAAPVRFLLFNAPPTAVATGPIKLAPMMTDIIARIAAMITSTAMPM